MKSVALVVGLLGAVWTAPAQERTVAITVDDLPYAGRPFGTNTVETVNKKLLAAFKAHHVPVTGFAIQNRVQSLGILNDWTSHGFDLGNHTWSHPDINNLSVEQIEEEIVQGEAGRTVEFFRFPMNHTGDTKEKHDAIAAFLAQRGYRMAPCTIDTSDYVFNNAYIQMLEKKDHSSARRLRADYLAYSSTEIDYYAALDKQVFAYESPEVMLLHDNLLNAEVIDQVLRLFEVRGYRFVSLSTALAEPAYRTPETYITKFGPMWGYRWARERNIDANMKLEQDPPKWVTDYGKQ